MIYKYIYSSDQTLSGYIEWTLAEFNTTEFPKDDLPREDVLDPDLIPDVCM